MKCLGLYLWKEWREFRSIAAGILVAVPLLVAIAGAVLPSGVFEHTDAGRTTTLIGGLAAMLIALFALTTDLFAGEVRTGRLSFLERLPGGLRMPFVAKAIVFATGTAAAFCYGFELTGWMIEWRGGSAPALADLVFHGRHVRPEFLLFALAVFCALPAACMTPRGVLALPLTALLVASLAGAAAYALHRATGSQAVLMSPWTWLVVVGGLLMGAYLAFAKGRRHGGSGLRAMRLGLVGFAIALLPALVPAAHAALGARGYLGGHGEIARAFLGRDARSVFVQRFSSYGDTIIGSRNARRIDLESGTVTELDGVVVSPAGRGMLYRQPVGHSHLRLDRRLFDTATMQPAADDALTEARRVATPLRDADGRPYVDEHGALCAVDFGVRTHRDRLFDCLRMRSYDLRAMRMHSARIRVRRGDWLVKRGNQTVWSLYDPDTEEWKETAGIATKDRVAAVHDDGRIFVLRAHIGRIDLVDPQTGQHEPISFEDGTRAQANWLGDAGGLGFRNAIARSPEGQRIMMVDNQPALFDESSMRLVRAGVRATVRVVFLGCGTEDRFYVLLGDTQIVRLRFGSNEHKLIYSEK